MGRRRGSHSPPLSGGGNRRRAARRTPRDNVRVTAGWVVARTLESLAPVDSFLAGALERFDDRDRGFLAELVYGTLRWLRRLDDVIDQASHRRFERIEHKLLAPLRIATYQLLFLDRVPSHAAVHEAVEQAGQATHRGGASFVNAVLRNIARSRDLAAWPVETEDPVERLAIELSHPDFLVRRWLERFGETATRELLETNNRPKPLHLLAFRDRGGRELLAEGLIDAEVEVEPSSLSLLGLLVRRGDPFASEAFRRGDFYVQDEASQVAALLPPPRPGERVLDAAAAPGGKSFALVAWEPEVRVTAADVDLLRLGVVRENLRRLRRSLPLLRADAAALPFADVFDRVVLDLPCTGTGTLRKHPELKWRVSEEEIGRLAAQGAALLAGAAGAVRPGGLLVAITCSLEPEENEEVVADFLSSHGDFHAAELSGLQASLDAGVMTPGRWLLPPGGEHDGFTVSVLRRDGG